jgi:hypothetical protein
LRFNFPFELAMLNHDQEAFLRISGSLLIPILDIVFRRWAKLLFAAGTASFVGSASCERGRAC